MRTIIHSVVCILLTASVLHAQGNNTPGRGDADPAPVRILTNDSYDLLDINRLGLWVSNNGSSAHNPLTDNAGLRWSQPNDAPLVYSDGLVWGGFVANELRVGGATYRHGLQAGPILPNGNASNAMDRLHRVFRLRRVNRSAYALLDLTEQQRLRSDFTDWPAQLGAPYEDVNGNGLYDPDFEAWLDNGSAVDHPQFPGEQILWFVSNDLDGSRTSSLYGTAPVGLEMQLFAWAGTDGPLCDNTIFIEYTLVNRGPAPYENMRIARWSDPDLGMFNNDCVGVDSVLALQYVYNGTKDDALFSAAPPAFGYIWLQTPLAPGGVTAGYGRDSREGFHNVPFDAFMFYLSGDPVFEDPALGSPEGAAQIWWNMNGRSYGGTVVDPTSNEETKLALNGNPVMGAGWIDGVVHKPGDRRQIGTTAGVDLAVGDTQKVVLALTVAEGGNHLLSVRALRNNARRLHDYYGNRRVSGPLPEFTQSITYPSAGNWRLHVAGGPLEADQVHAMLRDEDGTEIVSVSMLDDGLHGDGAAADGIYGGELNGSCIPVSGTLSVESIDANSTDIWFVENDIPLSGDVRVAAHAVLSDHLNYDGKINPGENVRIQLRFENKTVAEIQRWHVFPVLESAVLCAQGVDRVTLPVASGQDAVPAYDPSDPDSYLTVQIPVAQPPGTLRLPVVIIGERVGLWRDTLMLTVEDFMAETETGRLEHIEGNASGTLDYRIVSYAAIKPHRYSIDVFNDYHEAVMMRVTDETEGMLIVDSLTFPDHFGHDVRMIDGWKLEDGSAFTQILYDAEGNPAEDIPYPDVVWSAPERAWFTPYSNYLINGDLFFGSALWAYDLHTVRLVFDRSHGQKAYTWLRGGNPSYGFTGYNEIPVRAYDISDTTAPRQITLGFVENNGGATHNNTWDPGGPGDREYLFIFGEDYHETPRAPYEESINASATGLPVYFTIWPIRDTSKAMFEDGDSYTIIPRIPVSRRDKYLLDLTTMAVQSEAAPVSHYALQQSYPNPLGSTLGQQAIIRFDTPLAGPVRLDLYDLLGRKLRTLVDTGLDAGLHSVALDGSNLGPGTYLYVLTTEHTRLVRRLHVLR